MIKSTMFLPPTMSDAFEAAWSVIKADPEMSIREMTPYSSTYPMGRSKPSLSTMNPIIARLIRERNEQRAADKGRALYDFMRQRPDEPHQLTQYSGEKPHAEYGRHGMAEMPDGLSYEGKMEASRDAVEAAGAVPGERFVGDYMAASPENVKGPRRTKTSFAHQMDFPYGGRSGNYPISVQPGSPMAQMYDLAPRMKRLPEHMQPDWASEFRGD